MKRLGDILVESGFLNATELAEVLGIQKETGKRLGEVIVESGLMSEFDILRAVSSQYDYPIIDLTSIDVDPKATALLNQKFCEDNVVLPIGFDNDNLVVADELQNFLDEIIGKRVEFETRYIEPNQTFEESYVNLQSINFDIVTEDEDKENE